MAEVHKGTSRETPAKAHPDTDIAERIAKKFNKRAVIVLHMDEVHFGYASYGETKKECDVAKVLADECMALLQRRLK